MVRLTGGAEEMCWIGRPHPVPIGATESHVGLRWALVGVRLPKKKDRISTYIQRYILDA